MLYVSDCWVHDGVTVLYVSDCVYMTVLLCCMFQTAGYMTVLLCCMFQTAGYRSNPAGAVSGGWQSVQATGHQPGGWKPKTFTSEWQPSVCWFPFCTDLVYLCSLDVATVYLCSLDVATVCLCSLDVATVR